MMPCGIGCPSSRTYSQAKCDRLDKVGRSGRNRKKWEKEFAMACGGSMSAKPQAVLYHP